MPMLIDVDMQGTGPMDFTRADFADGPHRGKIQEVQDIPEGKGTYRFMVVDQEEGSPTFGITGQITMGKDWTKRGNRGHLANLLVGMGLPADKVTGHVKMDLEKVIGRDCYFHAKSPLPDAELDELGRTPLQDRNFITKEQYEATKRSQLAAKAAMNGATPTNGTAKPAEKAAPKAQVQTQPAATSTPAPAAGTEDLGDLFSNAP